MHFRKDGPDMPETGQKRRKQKTRPMGDAGTFPTPRLEKRKRKRKVPPLRDGLSRAAGERPRKRKRHLPWLWQEPFTLWCNGDCIRVWVGERVLHLPGERKGRKFLIRAKDLHHWGIGSGPWLSAKERTELPRLIRKKTRDNPFLQVVFI